MESYSATVSSKGQIVIPIKIRTKLKVSTGDTVGFIVRDDVITMQKGVRCSCPACKGSKTINERTCFVCDGSSELNPNVSLFHDIERVVRYSISVIMNNDRGDDEYLLPSFPQIQVTSKWYPKEIITWYQDYLQAKAVEEFVNRRDIENKTLNMSEVVDCFSSKEVRAAIIEHLPSVKKLSELVLSITTK